MPRSVPVTARLRDDVLRDVEAVAREEATDRSSALHRLLERGLQDYRLEKAVRLYREGKVTVWRAAELARVPLRAMMDELRRRQIPYDYDIEGLEETVREILHRRKSA